MEGENNTKLLKSLTQRKRRGKSADKSDDKDSQKKSTINTKTQSKFYSWWAYYAKKPQAKQAFDASLFCTSVFVIYNYGDYFAQKFQELCPTEQSILDMINKQQADMGMMPPPM